MQKKWPLVALISLTAVMVAGCAGPNPLADIAGTNGSIAGFWLGLWHGFICVFTLIISLFSNKVNFYEVHNSGGLYNFGFLLGFIIYCSVLRAIGSDT